MDTIKNYRYSTVYLEAIKVNSAIVLQYLRELQKYATVYIDGKRWFFCPVARQVCDKAGDETYRPVDNATGLVSYHGAATGGEADTRYP